MAARTYLDATDMERLRLFVYELQRLAEHLAMTKNPAQERLDGLLKRFSANPVGDRS